MTSRLVGSSRKAGRASRGMIQSPFEKHSRKVEQAISSLQARDEPASPTRREGRCRERAETGSFPLDRSWYGRPRRPSRFFFGDFDEPTIPRSAPRPRRTARNRHRSANPKPQGRSRNPDARPNRRQTPRRLTRRRDRNERPKAVNPTEEPTCSTRSISRRYRFLLKRRRPNSVPSSLFANVERGQRRGRASRVRQRPSIRARS